MFVILSHFHTPIADFLEHYGKVTRSVQHRCLRATGYMVALVIMALFFLL